MRHHLLTILICILSYCSSAQSIGSSNTNVTIKLEGASLESLYIRDYTDGRNFVLCGDRLSVDTWSFSIPDTIAADSELIEVWGTSQSAGHMTTVSIRFVSEISGNEITISNIGIEGSSNSFHGKYKRTTTFKDQPTPNLGESIPSSDNDLTCMDFEVVDLIHNLDLTVRAYEPYFGWFMSHNGTATYTYHDYLESYIRLSKRFPESRYMVINLSRNLNNFSTKEDVKRIFENFSDRHRMTTWHAKIRRFLNQTFDNIVLSNILTDSAEFVIPDTTKYNLIVFSASWCKPCIEEIPLLKQLYNDLGKHLDMTYITLDKITDIGAFRKLMTDHAIPWRALYSRDDRENIEDRYFINSIPQNILISPLGEFELIDVRKRKDLSRVYNEVQNIDTMTRSENK